MQAWLERNQRKGKATYSVRWTIEGQSRRQTFKSRHEALDFRAAILSGQAPELASAKAARTGDSPTPRPIPIPQPQIALRSAPRRAGTPWPSFIEKLYELLPVELRPSSVRRIKTIIGHFESTCRPKTIQEVDRATAFEFRAKVAQRTRGKKLVTRKEVNFEIEIMRRVFNQAKELGFIEVNPFAKIKPLRETDGRGEMIVLETAEIEAFKENCDPEFLPFFLILVRTGMRKSEMEALSISDYLREQRTLRIRNTKTASSGQNLYRLFPLNDGLIEMLDQRALEVGNSRLYVPSSHNWMLRRIKSVARKLIANGLLSPHKADIRLHDLRHTFASQFLARGGDLRSLMALMGHSRLETTQKYLHTLKERLREVANIIDY